MEDDQYLIWVNKALLSYQMVEEALKLGIGVSYEIIAASLPEEVEFKFSAEKINNAPLGSLVKMFSNVSRNEALIAALKSKDLTKWRNFFAHRAFMHEFTNRAALTPIDQPSAEVVEKVARYVGELVTELADELQKLRKIHAELHSG